MKSIIITLLTLALLYSPHGLAARSKRKRKPRRFPTGCRELGYKFEDQKLVLKSASDYPQTLYFIHNISQQTLELQALKQKDQPFSPKYSNRIRFGQWGVFATDEPELHFTCKANSRHGEKEYVDCGRALDVCQYIRVKFGSNNGGNYWVASSHPLYQAKWIAIRKGILLRW